MATQQQDGWVTRVLGVAVSGSAAASETATPAPALNKAGVAYATPARARLAAAIPALAALKAQGAPELPQLFAALEAAKGGLDGPGAEALLDRLDEVLARAKSAARGREAAASNRRGIAYPKLLIQWRTAQDKARAAVQTLGASILSMPEVQADPRLDLAKQAVTMLPGLIPKLGEQLADLLDKGINAGSDAAIAADALALVGTYRSTLAAAAPLNRLETFASQYAGGLGVLATLDAALAAIGANLAAAA